MSLLPLFYAKSGIFFKLVLKGTHVSARIPFMTETESFSFQGVLVVTGSAEGICIRPAEQHLEEMRDVISSLPSALDNEREYVRRKYEENGLNKCRRDGAYRYDNPFVNRGG